MKLSKLKTGNNLVFLSLGFIVLVVGINLIYFLDLNKPVTYVLSLSPTRLEREISRLEKLIQTTPEDLKVMVSLGLAYYQKGVRHYSTALNYLHRAYELGAQELVIPYYSGIMYDNLHLDEYAIREYERYLRNKPEDINLRLRLGNLYCRQNQLDTAIEHYEILYSQKPRMTEVLFNLALAYQKKGILDDAERIWLSALKIHGRLPPRGNYYLAEIYYQRNELDKAARFLTEELKNFPKFQPARQLLSRLILRKQTVP